MTDTRPTDNILLIVVDQWRGDALRAAGNDIVQTPNVDRLCARGVTFLNHFAQGAPCAPGRTAMLTGLYTANHRVVRNGTPMDARFTNLAFEARAAGYDPALTGYTTGTPDPRRVPHDDPRFHVSGTMMDGFSAIAPLFPAREPYFAYLRANGFPVPDDDPTKVWLPADTPENGEGISHAPAQYAAELTDSVYCTERALDYLRGRGGASWFLHLGYWRPHPPFIAPAPYHAMFDTADMPVSNRAASPEEEAEQHRLLEYFLTTIKSSKFFRHGTGLVADLEDKDFRQTKATYYGMMAEVDAQIGRVLDWLDETGAADDTLIVFTADHGEQMGDHHMLGKQGYFAETFHIPMIVVDPRAAANDTRGTTVSAFSEAVDFMPTVLDWMGRDIPRQCDGRSLLPFCHGDAPPDWRGETVYEFDFREVRNPEVERRFGLPMDHCSLAVIQDAHGKYVHFAGLPPLYFDLDDDPGEIRNLAQDDGYRGRVLDYAQRMLSWRLQNHERVLTGYNADEGGLVSRDR